MPDLKDTGVCGEPRTDGQFCPTLQHLGDVHTLDDGTVFRTVPLDSKVDQLCCYVAEEYANGWRDAAAYLTGCAEGFASSAPEHVRLIQAFASSATAGMRAQEKAIRVVAEAAAAPGGTEGSAVGPSVASEGPGVAAQPAETVDIAAWCRDRMEAFLSWESHEMAMFPSGAEREVAIVEWVVRVLGNPESSESAEVLRLLVARHEAVAHAAR
jgi:hypothetical protein